MFAGESAIALVSGRGNRNSERLDGRRRYGCTLDWLYLGEEHANSEGFKQRLAEARRAAAHRDGRRRRFRHTARSHSD